MHCAVAMLYSIHHTLAHVCVGVWVCGWVQSRCCCTRVGSHSAGLCSTLAQVRRGLRHRQRSGVQRRQRCHVQCATGRQQRLWPSLRFTAGPRRRFADHIRARACRFPPQRVSGTYSIALYRHTSHTVAPSRLRSTYLARLEFVDFEKCETNQHGYV